MRVIAAVPAAGLLAGAAAGVLHPELPPRLLEITLVALTAAASLLYLRPAAPPGAPADAGARLFMIVVAAAFAAGAVLLGSQAWHDAWRPSLRVAFERLALQDRSDDERYDEEGDDDRAPLAVDVDLTGVLRTDAALRESGASLLVDVVSLEPTAGISGTQPAEGASRAIGVRGGVALAVGGDMAAERIDEWRAGRTIRVPVQLRRPSRYLNPGVADGERLLARQGTTLVGSAKSALLVEVIAEGDVLEEAAAAARAHARRRISARVARWSEQSAGIVTAIVIGDRTGLDADTERRLQEAGTYHVIAISGGNIAVLTGLLLGLFRLAGRLNRSAIVVTMAALVTYAAVVGEGGGRSVERATLMAIVYLAGRLIDMRGAPDNALALVVALLLVQDPLAAVDPGFLLTCGATAGILLVVPRVQSRRIPRLLRPAVLLLAASIGVEVILLPVGSAFFSRVTLAGLVLNFLAVPLMALAQVAGMAVLPADLLAPSLGRLAGWLAHLGAAGLVRSAEFVEVAPWLTWRVAPPSAVALVVYYAGLAAAWALWRRRAALKAGVESPALGRARRIAGIAAAGAALWIVSEPWSFVTDRGSGQLHVIFLDVGQGDATFVRFPRGDTLLVDAGGLAGGSGFDIGDRVVAPVLRHLGVRSLGTAALSHAHPDHAGGLPAILREFRPRDVWDGVPVPPDDARRQLFNAAADVRARWTHVHRDDRLVIDGVDVIVRHPVPPEWERQDVRNDDSIVLELRWRDVSIVLPGDIGRDVEREIAPAFEAVPLRVLKVPHHGSLTSSSPAFLEALSPEIAVVSAGRGNRFGHPAPAVLERYEALGAEVFRTDRDGAISIETDGRQLLLCTFGGPTSAVAWHGHETTQGAGAQRSQDIRAQGRPACEF